MKKLLFLTGLICASWGALANEKIERALNVSPAPYVQIEHVNGLVKVFAWDKAEVKVTGTLGERTETFIFEKDDNLVLIKIKVKSHTYWKNWGAEDGDKLNIFVPRQSQVHYSAVNADVELEKIRGGAQIETVNGSIAVKELAGRIRLESINGNISAISLKGDVKIETVNGDIVSRHSKGSKHRYETVNGNVEVTSNSAHIDVSTVNGAIELDLGKVKQLNMDTVNGSIDAKLKLQKNAEIEASSVDGPVRLYLQSSVSAIFNIEGHTGGKIINNLSDDKIQKAKYGPSRWLKFSLNAGSAKVNVSTLSGTVQLGKQ